MQICLWQSAVCSASAASTAWSAAFRASSKVMVVFVNENQEFIFFHKFKFLEQKLSLTVREPTLS